MTVVQMFSEYADFFGAEMPPEKLINFKAPAHISKRVAELVAKKKEGKISKEEDSELERILSLDLFIGLAKARAHKKLADG